jgi:hypothetical protein
MPTPVVSPDDGMEPAMEAAGNPAHRIRLMKKSRRHGQIV